MIAEAQLWTHRHVVSVDSLCLLCCSKWSIQTEPVRSHQRERSKWPSLPCWPFWPKGRRRIKQKWLDLCACASCTKCESDRLAFQNCSHVYLSGVDLVRFLESQSFSVCQECFWRRWARKSPEGNVYYLRSQPCATLCWLGVEMRSVDKGCVR